MKILDFKGYRSHVLKEIDFIITHDNWNELWNLLQQHPRYDNHTCWQIKDDVHRTFWVHSSDNKFQIGREIVEKVW